MIYAGGGTIKAEASEQLAELARKYETEKVKAEIEDIIGLDASDAVLASAKSGIGIEEVLEAVVAKIPPPKGTTEAPLKASLVDSWYDPYLAAIAGGRRCRHCRRRVASADREDPGNAGL